MLQFGASLTDDTSIVIYDGIVFMIPATGGIFLKTVSTLILKTKRYLNKNVLIL